MSITCHPSGFYFGVQDKDAGKFPTLPRGYCYINRANDFLKVDGPRGERYFYNSLPKPRLIRCPIATKDDVRRTRGNLKLGKDFYDDRRQVLISFLVVNDKHP